MWCGRWKAVQRIQQAQGKDIYRCQRAGKSGGRADNACIVVIVDELNDLMMVCPGEVEGQRDAHSSAGARAAGIYLVLATQRPSVSNNGRYQGQYSVRMAFAVASSHDSKTILDRVGAERLVGKGDMLYHHNGESNLCVFREPLWMNPTSKRWWSS